MELKIPPLLLVFVFAALMYLIALVLPVAGQYMPALVWFGGLLAAAGVCFALAGVLAFRHANTTVDPRVPQQTSSLVIEGVYRYSRNPMYVGFFCLLAGWAVYLGSMVAALLLPVFVLYMNRFQIMPEERFMQEKFGAQYEAYCAQVRRWL